MAAYIRGTGKCLRCGREYPMFRNRKNPLCGKCQKALREVPAFRQYYERKWQREAADIQGTVRAGVDFGYTNDQAIALVAKYGKFKENN